MGTFPSILTTPGEELTFEQRMFEKSCLSQYLAESPIQASACRGFKSDQFLNAFTRVELPFRQNADYFSRVHQGGKLASAQAIVCMGIDMQWKVPKRNLETGAITEYLQFSRTDLHDNGIPATLRWFGLQVVMNSLVKKCLLGDQYFHPFKTQDGIYSPHVFRERIIFIGEPGKLRPLTAGTPFIYWGFSPYAKFLQGILAADPDHECGLVGGSDAYSHLSRILPTGASDFLWKDDGTIRERTCHCFSDWSSATDRMKTC